MHKVKFRPLWVLVGLAGACVFVGGGLAGCSSANISASTVRDANRLPPKMPEGSLPATPVVGSTDYRLGPQDLVAVEVFQLDDLNREVRISASGDVSLPLIGRVPAANRTAAELETDIASRLKAGYLQNPQVTVFVKEYLSQRVTVEGAVAAPGIYPLNQRMTLLQMIATARGLAETANPAACVVYRNLDGKRYAAAFDIREVRAGRLLDPEIIGGDVVVVDYSGAREKWRDFLSTFPMLSVFRIL